MKKIKITIEVTNEDEIVDRDEFDARGYVLVANLENDKNILQIDGKLNIPRTLGALEKAAEHLVSDD